MNKIVRKKHAIVIAILSLMLAAAIAHSYCFGSAGDGAALPGTDAPFEAIRFDALLRIRQPEFGSAIALYARYWVTRDAIRTEVVWCEPHWNSVNYGYYPVSLLVRSDKDTFTVANSVRGKKWSYSKPAGPRGVFSRKFNDYPVGDLRYTEEESLSGRVLSGDVHRAAGSAEGKDACTYYYPETARRSYDCLSVKKTDGLLRELALAGPANVQPKSIEYSYDISGDSPRLAKEAVTLHEHSILVGGTEALDLTVNGKRVRYSTWPTDYHRGGRDCSVTYRTVPLAGKRANVPVSIKVSRKTDGRFLRGAEMTGFTLLDGEDRRILASPEASRYSRYTFDESLWRALVIRNWLKDSNDITAEDQKTFKRLGQAFGALQQDDGDPGHRLKHTHMLCMVNMMLGRNDESIECFRRYLGILKDSRQYWMMLVGGQEFINLAIRWRKMGLADKAISLWTDLCLESCNTSDILEMISKGVARSQFYTFYILGASLESESLQPEERFELHYLLSVAADSMLHTTEADVGEFTKLGVYHYTWAGLSASDLRNIFEEEKRQALTAFNEIDTPSQRHLRMLRKIRQLPGAH